MALISPQGLEIDFLIPLRRSRIAGVHIEHDVEREGPAVLGSVGLGAGLGRRVGGVQDGAGRDEVVAIGGGGVGGLLVVDAYEGVFVGGVDLDADGRLGSAVRGC